MNAIAIDTISSSSSFETLDPALLGDVAGGFDFGRMVNAGNANVETGAKAGAALGGATGTTAGAALGSGIGWVGGAASDAWSQLRGR